MNTTSAYKQQVKELRNEMLNDIRKKLESKKNNKIKFTETQAPRYIQDSEWLDLTEIRLGFFGEPEFGAHSKKASAAGANTWFGSAQVSTEIILKFHELIFG